jgi:Domain of unknown function (DUF4386)
VTTQTTQPATTARRTQAVETSAARPRRIARIAGASYLLMFALAILANVLVLDGLVAAGDPAATTANIASSPGLLRTGILAFLLIVLLDITLAWALQVVFRSVDRELSLVMAWFRLGYSVMLAVALVFLVQALTVATATVASADTAAEQTMHAIDAFKTTWLLGLCLFGVHLVLLGALVARSRFAPRVLGYILAFAGLAYVADTVAQLAVPGYSAVSGLFLALVAVPSMLGEGWLGIWLLTTRRLPAR